MEEAKYGTNLSLISFARKKQNITLNFCRIVDNSQFGKKQDSSSFQEYYRKGCFFFSFFFIVKVKTTWMADCQAFQLKNGDH